jgi:hypothetical protein
MGRPPAARGGGGGAAAAPRARSAAGAAARAAAMLLLLLAAAASAPRLASAQDDSSNPASVFDLVPSQTDALSAINGCGGPALGPNLNDCVLEDNIKIGDNHEYTFNVPDAAGAGEPFSILLTSKSIGGFVEM